MAMSVVRRIGVVVVGIALALTLPGAVGIASADKGSNTKLTAPQVAAVTAARSDYLKSAWQAKITYRTEVAKSRDAMDAALQGPRLNVLLTKDAYEVVVKYGGDTTGTRAAMDSALSAYRTAYTAALATARTQTDAARTTLRTALDKAKATYVAAVTAAFPGTTVPKGLLNPPGRGMGWFNDHDGWMGLMKEFGIPKTFDTASPMGMAWAWGHD